MSIVRSEKDFNALLDETDTIAKLKHFFNELKIAHKIGAITGGTGEGKTSVALNARHKIPAVARPLDDDFFKFYTARPDEVAEAVNAYPNFKAPTEAETNEKLMKFHMENTCKSVDNFYNMLIKVGPFAEHNFCKAVLKRRKDAILEKLGIKDTNWLDTDSVQMPDIGNDIVEGFALWESVGNGADKIWQIVSSRPDMAGYLIAKRQGLYIPKELDALLQTGANLAEAKKTGIIVPYELEHFMDCMENVAGVAAERIRKKTLCTLEYSQLVNHIVVNETGKMTDEEMQIKRDVEIKRLGKRIIAEFPYDKSS